jgi:hypothetical protein
MPRKDGTTKRPRSNNKLARRRWQRRKVRINEARRPRKSETSSHVRESPPLMLKGSLSATTEMKADEQGKGD